MVMSQQRRQDLLMNDDEDDEEQIDVALASHDYSDRYELSISNNNDWLIFII